MARKPRFEAEGAAYHIMARGSHRARVFHAFAAQSLFVETLKESLERFGVGLHAWVLMPNHFHLAATTRRGNLIRWMAWLQTTFTIRYNRMRKRVGHLFHGRYRAQLVDTETYAMTLVRYIHLNPVRRKKGVRRQFVGGMEELEKHVWSGHLDLAGLRATPLIPLDQGWMRYWGNTRTKAAKRYLRDMKLALGGEPESWRNLVQGGLVAGTQEFIERAVDQLKTQTNLDTQLWRRPSAWGKVRAKLKAALRREKSPAIQAWVRTRILGEKSLEVAREMGYADGSGVCQATRRLEVRSKQDKPLAQQLASYRKMSIIKNRHPSHCESRRTDKKFVVTV
jgi:REP element-mobilizing transposase RayT